MFSEPLVQAHCDRVYRICKTGSTVKARVFKTNGMVQDTCKTTYLSVNIFDVKL